MIVPANEVRIVLTTAGSREEGERIARTLVEDHCAACVNIVPGITSVYRWQGEVESAEEVLLLIKTAAAHLDEVQSVLRRVHSYELPEILVFHPESGSKSYIEWVLNAVARH